MMDTSYSVQASQLAKHITMYVTIGIKGYRVWKWRLALGVWLIRLAARIMQVKIEVEVKEMFTPYCPDPEEEVTA